MSDATFGSAPKEVVDSGGISVRESMRCVAKLGSEGFSATEVTAVRLTAQ